MEQLLGLIGFPLPSHTNMDYETEGKKKKDARIRHTSVGGGTYMKWDYQDESVKTLTEVSSRQNHREEFYVV